MSWTIWDCWAKVRSVRQGGPTATKPAPKPKPVQK
jgi:hypothetical protein